MKSWLKKIISTSQYEMGQQNGQQNMGLKGKKVIVNFDRHQSFYNLNLNSNKKQFKKLITAQSNEQYRNNSQIKNKQGKTIQKQRQNIDNNQFRQQTGIKQPEQKDNYQMYEHSSQIVNNLINMQNLIRMIKNIPDIKGQYITLVTINKYLSQQNPSKQLLIEYILSKTSEQPSSYLQKSIQKQNKPLKNLIRKYSNIQAQRQIKKQQAVTNFYYTKYSNGLLYQYYPIRALIWKLVSNYLLECQQKWIWKMEVSLLKYRQKIKEFIIQTKLKKCKSFQAQRTQQIKNLQIQTQKEQSSSKKLQSQPQTQTNHKISKQNLDNKVKDHPLNSIQSSKWKNYFSDFELWSIIERDTIRTRQNYTFFNQNNVFALTNDTSTQQNDTVKIQLKNGSKIQYKLNELHLSKNNKQKTTYIDALTRIIFVYLKTYPEQKYYQGINQFAAIIYYSFTNKNSQYFRRVSQSDTYQIFTLLMQNLNISPLKNPQNKRLPPFNHFISGQKYFIYLKNMIKKYDFRFYDHLQKTNGFQQLKVISIRWFMTIFLTQFTLDQCLVIWDVIMVLLGNNSNNQKGDRTKNLLQGLKLTEFILYLALAVIHLNRKQIYEQDVDSNDNKNQNSNILMVFQKIKQKPEEIIQKAIYLSKSFSDLID